MKHIAFSALLVALATPLAAQTNVTPNLGTTVGTAAWYTDRYDPAGFTLTNGFQGRNDVLNIAINSTTNAVNRGGQSATFYNTQGRKLDVNTSGSWYFQSDIFVDASWANAQNGYVRSDMWATQCNGVCTPNVNQVNVTDFPIIGFTNYDGAARFRGFTQAGWVNFAANAVNFGAWNTLMMSFDAVGNTFSYAVNGSNALTFAGNGPSTGVANVMFQAYNFNDPALSISGNPDYIARWSNTPGGSGANDVVPEPATMTLLATGLAGMAAARRRKAKQA